VIFATFWMFFVVSATFLEKINDFSGIYLSFLAIRSRETGGRSQETGDRRQESGELRMNNITVLTSVWHTLTFAD
jgi:hypothetical protein